MVKLNKKTFKYNYRLDVFQILNIIVIIIFFIFLFSGNIVYSKIMFNKIFNFIFLLTFLYSIHNYLSQTHKKKKIFKFQKTNGLIPFYDIIYYKKNTECIVKISEYKSKKYSSILDSKLTVFNQRLIKLALGVIKEEIFYDILENLSIDSEFNKKFASYELLINSQEFKVLSKTDKKKQLKDMSYSLQQISLRYFPKFRTNGLTIPLDYLQEFITDSNESMETIILNFNKNYVMTKREYCDWLERTDKKLSNKDKDNLKEFIKIKKEIDSL